MNLILDYKGFEDYLFESKPMFDGIQYVFKFENGYGASVIKHIGSYGHEDDLWELAMLRWEGDRPWLIYSTDITDDVIGYLSDKEVRELLQRIKEL